MPSLYSSNGSKLNRTEAEKITGSCGIIPSLDLKIRRGTVEVSIPSTRIFPADISWIRNKAIIILDFPDLFKEKIYYNISYYIIYYDDNDMNIKKIITIIVITWLTLFGQQCRFSPLLLWRNRYLWGPKARPYRGKRREEVKAKIGIWEIVRKVEEKMEIVKYER